MNKLKNVFLSRDNIPRKKEIKDSLKERLEQNINKNNSVFIEGIGASYTSLKSTFKNNLDGLESHKTISSISLGYKHKNVEILFRHSSNHPIENERQKI